MKAHSEEYETPADEATESPVTQKAEQFVNQSITQEQAAAHPYAAISREMHLQARLRIERRGKHYDLGEAFAADDGNDETYLTGGVLRDELEGDPVFGEITR